jgi:hypothetical protein
LNNTYIKFEYGYKWWTFLYSQVLFLQVFTCSIIVSFQSFIQLMEFLKPSSTQQNTILGCMDSLTWTKQRWWMFDPTPQICDVAWSHNLTFALEIHSMVISTIVSCKQAKAQSMATNEPFGTSTLLKQLFSFMAISPLMSPHRLDLGCNLHCWIHHHPIISMSGDMLPSSLISSNVNLRWKQRNPEELGTFPGLQHLGGRGEC